MLCLCCVLRINKKIEILYVIQFNLDRQNISVTITSIGDSVKGCLLGEDKHRSYNFIIQMT